MNKHNLLMTMLAAAGVFSWTAVQAVTETESNDSLATAQSLSLIDSVTIDGILYNQSDVDYFKVYGRSAGDLLDIDINNGMYGTDSVNTSIAVYNADGVILSANDDEDSSNQDSRISSFVIPAKGTYTIGVTNYKNSFLDGGALVSTSTSSGSSLFGGFFSASPDTAGDYQLKISYTGMQIKQVAIKLNPGVAENQPVNSKSAGIVKVAILSTADFRAPVVVVPGSLTFGATGSEAQKASCRTKEVNKDGMPDLVCKFSVRAAGFSKGDLEANLKGVTIDGSAFEGSGYINVIK